MRRICSSCGVVAPAASSSSVAAPEAQANAGDSSVCGAEATTCAKCNEPLRLPTVFDCARLGLLPELQQLIAATPDFDVNALEEASNATLLHHAAVNSKMRILEFLFADPMLKRAIRVDALGGELQTTPLFWAAYHHHIYAVELLLRNGADAGFMDGAGFNAFLLSIQRCSPITAAYLVAKGTDIDVRMRDRLERTALMMLCTRERFHLDSFRMVLSLQASVDLQDADGNTALHHAAMHDLGLGVRMLLDSGADPTVANALGETPLHLARTHARPKSVALHLLTEDAQLQRLARYTGIQKATLEANVYKLSFFVPWLLLPAVGAIVVHSDSALRIAWREALLVAATALLLKLLQRGTYGDKQKAAALMLGVNLSSVVCIAASFPRLAAATGASAGYQLLMAFAVTMTLWCLFKTATTDAGVVSTSYSEKLANIRRLVESKSPVATKLCLSCLHRRPLRSKHCPELKACIARFDHYCPFTVNAIGAENHDYFVGFLAFAELGIGLVLATCWRFLALRPDVLWMRGALTWLWSVAHFEPALLCVAALAAAEFVWIGYLLGFHAFLVLSARTTYEFIRGENDARAFSRGGRWRNAVDFFRLPRAARVDWTRVFSIEDFHAASGRQAAGEGPATKPKAL
ncbi:hypothetical protein PybrP1_010717 [[Pythium] brassicae (nom. inval.)]|nr:hypothetical protein PybrP1_010717 [[Pythium] brassicae (nom. inval.)]